MQSPLAIAFGALWAATLCAATVSAQAPQADRDGRPAASVSGLEVIPLAEERMRRPAAPVEAAEDLREEDTVARVAPLEDRDASRITPLFPAGLAAPEELLAPQKASGGTPVAVPQEPLIERPAGSGAEATVREAVAVPMPTVDEETLAPPAATALAEGSATERETETADATTESATPVAAGAESSRAGRIVSAETWRRALAGINRPSASLADQSGRLTIVHFWADWCGPCKEELPLVEAFWRGDYRALSERGLRMVTISNDMRHRDAEGVMREYGLTFPAYLDKMQAINRELAGTRALPLTVLVDETGAVETLSVGKYDWDPGAFERRLAAMDGTS